MTTYHFLLPCDCGKYLNIHGKNASAYKKDWVVYCPDCHMGYGLPWEWEWPDTAGETFKARGIEQGLLPADEEIKHLVILLEIDTMLVKMMTGAKRPIILSSPRNYHKTR